MYENRSPQHTLFMDYELLWKGAGLGLSIAAPVGPIGLLCIRKTLESGYAAGFATGMGAAVADFCYGLAAAMGLSVLAGAIAPWMGAARLAGAILLLHLAWKTFRSAPAGAMASTDSGIWRSFAGTFLLTVTNPMTILSFAAIFTGITGGALARTSGLVLAGGVLIGSMAWWLALTALSGCLRSIAAPKLSLINKVAAMMLAVFALSLAF